MRAVCVDLRGAVEPCTWPQGGKLSAKEKRLLKKAGPAAAAPEPEPEGEPGWRSLSEGIMRKLEGFSVRYTGQGDDDELPGGGKGKDVMVHGLCITEPVCPCSCNPY